MATFEQPVVDVSDAAQLRAALASLQPSAELAVDVEADSLHAFRARLCFVQVGTDREILLFDTLEPDVKVSALAGLFADAGRTKFFHAAGGDLQYLSEAGIRVRGLFDTHRAATLLGWPKVGLADLAREHLQVELSKEHQQSDFAVRPLPSAVHAYIADDVRYLTELGRRVRQACREADITEEVELECQRLADQAVDRPAVGADFKLKLPSGGRSGVQMAVGYSVAQALHAKRLAWAEAADIPMGRMLSNAALKAIGLRLPSQASELKRCEGVRGAFVREHGDEVLALIRATLARASAGELPSSEPPARADPQRRRREEALKGFRVAKAAERNVTASVVLPLASLAELVAKPPVSLEQLAQLPYFGEKRLSLYGVELVKLLGGQRS